MTFTFTNNPSNSDRDLVRILINDTSTANQNISDEFITYALADKPNAYLAASLCAGTIASQNTGTATKKRVGDLALWYDSKAADYRTLAKELRLQAASKVTPFSGGISVDDKDNQRDDADWDRPFAEIGMHDADSEDPAAATGWH